MAVQLLLIEDDEFLGSSTKVGLEQDGYTVDWVTDAEAADRAFAERTYGAAILDLGLPRMGGEDLLSILRARGDLTPVVVLTGRGSVLDRVRLLNLGADDYLVKPCDLIELIARVHALVRRAAAGGSTLQLGRLQLILDSQTVVWHGQPVAVTSKEFLLLEALVRNKNRVLTRRQLEVALYGWSDEVESNAIEVHVHHLRRKLSKDLIQTVRGSGYAIQLEAAASPLPDDLNR